ncbi:hypothetical protein PAPYR_9989 [Paratrimastix pyriformis]|uniref:Uncharacterized protein n=1 Tax=Paratrimastix pyriformis TaxID=342808 RepID=A0ABQ8U716_9EUKA|nr:hypothetical protein PAPYR_9989 [Paratrimastix pyriformis]
MGDHQVAEMVLTGPDAAPVEEHPEEFTPEEVALSLYDWVSRHQISRDAYDDLGRLCRGTVLNHAAPHSMYKITRVVYPLSCQLLEVEVHDRHLSTVARTSDSKYFTLSLIQQIRNYPS